MWEDFIPENGKPYPIGAMGMLENGNRYSWVDVTGVHNTLTSRCDRFRRLVIVSCTECGKFCLPQVNIKTPACVKSLVNT